MKDFRFKLNRSNILKSTKRKNYFRGSKNFFHLEKQDESYSSISNSSQKPSNTLNTNNFSNYNSFQKNNKSSFNGESISKSNILNNSNNISPKKNISSIKLKKEFSQIIPQNKRYSLKNKKSLNNLLVQNNNNSNNSNISNEIKNKIKINNNKIISLRNSIGNINSRNFSTVKEEPEQATKIKEENNSNEKINNSKINNEFYKLKIFYEGIKTDLTINKNEKFKKLILLIQKQLFPYHQITEYDILYKLKTIDITSSLNIKLIDLIGNISNDDIPTFLLRKKEIYKEKYNSKGITITIENFPSLTDLAIDLNYFFKKETEESDFIIDYKKNNICKVIFYYPEKAFSLVSYLSKLKLKNPIYKRLKVKLDYKINPITNIKKDKGKSEKIMLPYLKKETIYNIKNKNIDFYIKSPIFKRKNIKLFLPNYFSFSKNSKKIKNKGEDILFLYKQKQSQKQNNENTVNNNIKIMSYIEKIKPTQKNIEPNNNKKVLSLFNNDKIVGNTPKRAKRNSVFYQQIINIDNEDKNNNDIKNNQATNNLTMRSWSNINRIKSKIINNNNNKIKNNININKNINENNNIKIIDNSVNKEIKEEKKELNLIELLKEAKMSEDSNDSSEEESSIYDNLNNVNNKKYLFKNKNKKFVFFNGLTKREKRKKLEYVGKKDD